MQPIPLGGGEQPRAGRYSITWRQVVIGLIVAGWMALLLFSTGYLPRRMLPAPAEALAVASIVASGCLLSIWCALGCSPNLLRLFVTLGLCLGWGLFNQWVGSRITPDFLMGLLAVAAPLFVGRLFGLSIRFRPPSLVKSSQRPVWFPRFRLRNLFELVTGLALVMPGWRLILNERFSLDNGYFPAWGSISLLTACAVWAALGSGRLWMKLLACSLAPLSLAFVLANEMQGSSLLCAYGILVAIGATLLVFRRLGYRLVPTVTATPIEQPLQPAN